MGLLGKIKDAVFGSGSSGSSSQSSSAKGSTSSTSRGSSDTTYKPLDTTAINRLQGIASTETGLAGDLSESLKPYLSSLYGTLTDQLGNASDVSDAFYTSALEGVDPTEKANQAENDVVNAFSKGTEAWKRNLGQYGINPNNMASTARQNEIEQSKAIAGARTSATNQAQDDSWSRLLSAMGVAGNTSLNTSNATNLTSAISNLLSGATSASTAGLTTGSTSTDNSLTSSGTTKSKSTGSGKSSSTSTPSWWDIFGKVAGTAGSAMTGAGGAGA